MDEKMIEPEIKECWNCDKEFESYEYIIHGETLIQDQFCCPQCEAEWYAENRHEFL